MKTIFVCYGIPASGKDSWAREQMQKYPGRFKRVNKDLMREMLDINFDFRNEKYVVELRDTIIEKSLVKNFDVICTDTNFPFGGRHFLRICEIAEKVGDVLVIEKFFDITLKEAKRANQGPNRRVVPEDTIDNMYKKHIENTHYTCGEHYFKPFQKVNPDGLLPNCCIYDIDGTLAHSNGKRGPYDLTSVINDDVDWDIKFINNMLGQFTTSFVVSGREDICREDTMRWLEMHKIKCDNLFMRKAGDMRKDSVIKEEILRNNIIGKWNIIAIFDDRNQVVDCFRRMGYTTCQVANGDF